ncbi:MAG: DNA-directed RNA polymerase subunit omega [Gemmatimonadetes bacterium]|nr:DNA-directed RNA polymerase subunit omega [Gemmatimonadota bacterium]
MRVFTPHELTKYSANKYLGVLIAAKFARMVNEFPRTGNAKEKKLTTRALEELSGGRVEYRVVPRKRPTE